jgi:DNA-binding Xre family transcriptional regulator
LSTLRLGGIEHSEQNVALMNLLKIADALEMKLSEILVAIFKFSLLE